MAETDISVFNISGGVDKTISTASIKAAAESQTVPHSGKDNRLALRIANGSVEEITVTVVAQNGPRAALRDMEVTVAANSTAYIALFDTARYKDLVSGAITVELSATESVTIEAVQL